MGMSVVQRFGRGESNVRAGARQALEDPPD